MEKAQYYEITGKVLEAEKKVTDAVHAMRTEVRAIVEPLTKQEVSVWLAIAADDDAIAPPVFDMVVDEWFETHSNQGGHLSVGEMLAALAALKKLVE